MKTLSKIIDINAHITNIVCVISVENNVCNALISFDNLAFGMVTAVKFHAKGFNSFGDIVQVEGEDQFYLIIQDITIDKNASAKNLKVQLPNSDIRRLELEECQICYADGTILHYGGVDSRECEIKRYDSFGSEKEIIDAIREILSPKAKSIPQDIDSGWICSCERYNSHNLTVCSNCGIEKSEIFKITDPTFIADILASHKKTRKNKKKKYYRIPKKENSLLKEEFFK